MIELKKNIWIICLSLLGSISSCQDIKTSEKPEDLIVESKMVDIISELAIFNSARNFSKTTLENTGLKPKEYIYKKFGVDSLQFERSNNYYAENYIQYERIYDSVRNRLQVLKEKLDSIRDLEIKVEDSLKLLEKDSIKNLENDSIKNFDSLKILKYGNKKIKLKDSLLKPASFEEDTTQIN